MADEPTTSGSNKEAKILVLGDEGIDQFVYISTLDTRSANNRESWVQAQEFESYELPACAASFVEYLELEGISANGHFSGAFKNHFGKDKHEKCEDEKLSRSIFILTDYLKDEVLEKILEKRTKESKENPQKGEAVSRQQNALWLINQAIPSKEVTNGEPAYSCQIDLSSLQDSNLPVAIIEYQQGWLDAKIKSEEQAKSEDFTNQKESKKVIKLSDFLQNRACLIRAHDPCLDIWKEVRKKQAEAKTEKPIIWFSSIQDMGAGLAFSGNWNDIYQRVEAYFKQDDSFWKNEEWQTTMIVLVGQDGAILFEKKKKEGRLWIFPGDQYESFRRAFPVSFVGAGLIFSKHLAEYVIGKSNSLEKKIEDGLDMVRCAFERGYIKRLQVHKTNLVTSTEVKKQLEGKKQPIREYNLSDPFTNKSIEEVRKTATILLTTEYENYVEFRIGEFETISSNYARKLVRLAKRLENFLCSSEKDGIFSYAILGEPGSGKSFLAEQVIEGIHVRGQKIAKPLTVNLSQYQNTDMLIHDFRKIEQICLRGEIPFVIWDEFDSVLNDKRGGWLQKFLMPMQDSKFIDGSQARQLGKAIFVFVGGTFSDENAFREWLESEQGRMRKGPDFHSRLDSSFETPSMDIYAIEASKPLVLINKDALLVRAHMLRVYLKKYAKGLEKISEAVLDYLLFVPLQHGARSFEKIIMGSELENVKIFDLMHLPPQDVLRLHVGWWKDATSDTISPMVFNELCCDPIQFLNEMKKGHGAFQVPYNPGKPPVEVKEDKNHYKNYPKLLKVSTH